MTITFELPGEILQRLREEGSDVNALTKENALVELYRRDKISRYELSQAMGLNRFETDGLLKKHHVTEDLPTNEEMEEDFRKAMELVRQ